MATTRIISMHVNQGKTIADCLTDRIDYSKNPDKTQGGELISAYECDPKTADAEFLFAKRQYKTLTGREQQSDVIAYQVRQSFKPGEITPEDANRVGYEFAERFLKGRHAFFVATHTDKKHIHNHIIWNSTTLDCKHKFRDFLGSGRAIARLSDAICTEHRLSVIAAPKRGKNHYGKWLGDNAKPTHKPESEWIRHEALHEAIISPEVWNEVQAINHERTRLSADNAPPKPFLFTGKLICADCKAPLQGNRETQRRKNGTSKKYVSYFCSRYTASGYGACSRHTIYEMTLTELVLSEIRAHAEALELDEAAMLDRLQAQRTAADAERLESVRQEIGKLRRRVYELEQMTAKLYEDKVCGSISAASFAVLLEKTEQERRQRTDRLDTLLAEVREYEQSAADIQSWAAVVRKHLHIRELDRETVDELIDRIEVGEKTVIDGKNVRDIKIYYRFVGNI